MRYCTSCGAALLDGFRFCVNCGATADAAPATAAEPIVEPVPAPVAEEPVPVIEEPAAESAVEEPVPAAEAATVEEPVMMPEYIPEPVAEPEPVPVVEPVPAPAPAPVVEPVPAPAPAPVFEPAPAPIPAPAPVLPTPIPTGKKNRDLLGFGGAFVALLLFCIPGVNLITAIIWAVGGARNNSRRNLSRAWLLLLLAFVLFAACLCLLVWLFAKDQLNDLIGVLKEAAYQYGWELNIPIL